MKTPEDYTCQQRLYLNDLQAPEESEAEMLVKLAQDDTELLRRYVLHGDQTAFVELCRRYRGLILDVANRIIRNTHDAEDVAQLVLLEFASDAATVKTNLPGWLRSVTVRRAWRWRQESIRRTLAEAIVAEQRHELSSRSAEEIVQLVRMSIDDLPDQHRIVFKLRFYEGKPYRQIGALLRLDAVRVKAVVNDAADRLRRSLSAYAIPLATSALVCCLNQYASAMAPSAEPGELIGVDNSPCTRDMPMTGKPDGVRWPVGGIARLVTSKLAIGSVAGLFALFLAIAMTRPKVLSGLTPFASVSAYDMLVASYKPVVDLRDPLGFGAKITDMTAGELSFWRGSRLPLIRWCRENEPAWLTDDESHVLSPGRIDPLAIGCYSTVDRSQRSQIGLLDNFDAARMPFQLDLLEGWISLQLAARQNGISLESARDEQLSDAYFGAYRLSYTAAFRSGFPPNVSQAASRFLGSNTGDRAANSLSMYVEDNHFRADAGRLVPAMQRADEFAAAIEKTSRQSTLLRQALRPELMDDVRSAIRDIVRIRSPQGGLKDYLVLMHRPLRDSSEDAILIFRRHIPATTEREHLSGDIRSGEPARQVGEAVKSLRYPLPTLACWCNLPDGSYEIALFEPKEVRLDVSAVRSLPELLDTARLLGYLLGKAHRAGQDTPLLAPQLTDELIQRVRRGGKSFISYQQSIYQDFLRDPRTQESLAHWRESLDR